MVDNETGLRFTVKKYHSEKIVTEDSWAHQRIQLLPLNSDFPSLEIDPREAEDMSIRGEFVAVI